MLAAVTVELFDDKGTRLESTYLDSPATVRVELSPSRVSELGGLPALLQADREGRLKLLTRSGPGQPWREIDFRLEPTAGGAVVVTSEVRDFSEFVIVVEAAGPVFPVAGPVERRVAENASAGDAVGAPVSATTIAGGVLVYTLGGPDAAFFAIDAATGQIRVGAGTALDYEGDQRVYQVEVATEDSSGFAAVTVNVRVTDVDLGPYDADDNETIDRDEALAAVADYFQGLISKVEAIAVILLYSAG